MSTSGETIPVIGYGPVGQQTGKLLVDKGYSVRAIQRSPPAHLPQGASFVRADATDTDSLIPALAGARTVILALGLPYDGKVWAQGWPKAMSAVLGACEQTGARLVYADSLYLYGPQNRPLTEDLPPVDYGRKPTARSNATRLWQRAFVEGRVMTAAVRAPDFYGPGVTTSILGAVTLGRLAQRKPAQILASADHLHDVVHVKDFARALVTLAEASDDAFGQAWHVPTPPTLTLRGIIAIAAAALAVPARISVVPVWQARLAGLFLPEVREAAEMHFLTDRAYLVDSSKFRERFWSDNLPLEDSVAEAALSFRHASGR
ncbi:MAG: NAD-dependent epimerase-dehydratase [Oceanicaulis sp. HLUCCA04]|nr:MAG: NAD-dependent epimerase-dehydratase [Oceanicaulis sp. HLUCCA04]